MRPTAMPLRSTRAPKLAHPKPRDGGLNGSPTHLLHRANQCVAELCLRQVPGDLTPRQYTVLLTLAGNDGLSHAGLIERTGIDRSTISDIVQRMVKKGLLHRRRTRKDARTYAITMTEDGWLALEAAQPIMQRIDGQILENLPLRSRDAFLRDLSRIVMHLACTNGTGA